jgi:hypothetical protein
MSHLNPSELIDLLDEVLPPSRQAHVRECGRCRDEAARARLALEEAQGDEAPEPSPLFWEHFASRVREAVRSDSPPSRWTIPAWRPVPVMAVIATLVLAVAGIWYAVGPRWAGETADTALVQPLGTPATDDDLLFDGANGNGGWDLVAREAESLEWDEVTNAAGLTLRPGTAERAWLQLSEEQQAELARLLEAEIGRLPS